MADDQTAPVQPAGLEEQNAALLVNLQVVSPSAGVNTMAFTGLPASTTLRQVKEKIRELLASRPVDNQQRLIHRGRLLDRDTDTLLDVFGSDLVSGSPLLFYDVEI